MSFIEANMRSNWEDCTLLKVFEIPVYDIELKEESFILFNIELKKYSFIAYHEALNLKEEKSAFIPFISVNLDPDFTLDDHLDTLYNNAIEKIANSSLFNLNFS